VSQRTKDVLSTIRRIGIAVFAGFAISACATISTGTDQAVRVITEKDVVGASCTFLDSEGNRSYIPRTPGTTYMPRGNAPLTVTCKKPGYKPATFVVEEGMAGATMGNVILGGGIGFIFDAASGAAQRYPDEVVVWLEPEEWSDEASKLQWEEEKRAFFQQSAPAMSDQGGDENETGF